MSMGYEYEEDESSGEDVGHDERPAIVEAFATLAKAGTPIDVARDTALSAVSRDVAEQLARGVEPERALRAFGAAAADDLVDGLRRSELLAANRPLLDFILYAVNDQHRYDEIPDLACIEAHLPPDRDAEDHEWDEAIRICSEQKRKGRAAKARPLRAAAQPREVMPTLACLTAHLPTDRGPTLDEVRRAWETCVNDVRR